MRPPAVAVPPLHRWLVAAGIVLAVPASAAAAPGDVVLKAARLFDGTSDKLVANPVVLVRGGAIVSIGSGAAALPTDAQVIDLGDATLVPGFIDAHTHISGESSADWNKDVVDDLRRGVPEATLRAAAFAKKTLRIGFTTLRDVGSRDFIDVGLAEAIDKGYVEGPRIIPSAKSIGARGGHCDDGGFPPGRFGHEPGLLEGVASGADGFRDAVRTQIKYGAQSIKICATGGVLSLTDAVDTPQLSDAEMAAIVDEAHRLHRKVAAHAHGDVGARAAVAAGVDSIEHGTFLTRKTFELMKARGTYLVPTMSALEAIDPSKRQYPPAIAAKARAAIAGRAASMKLAIAVGVNIALGTDAAVGPHGQNAREFALMVRAGMTPLAALRAGTSAAARLLGVADKVGTLAAGKRADIVAVPGNPLQDVTVTERAFFVMKDGAVVRNDAAKSPAR